MGSGKGYLSSFLSLQYNLKVYGIDSSNTNTRGANERNRKLKKHWTAYQRRVEANVRDQTLKEGKKNAEQDKEKCNANPSEMWLRTNNLQNQVQVAVSDAIGNESAEISPDPNIGIIKNQYELKPEVRVQLIENNIPENVFLDILPTDAVEVDCSSRSNCRKLCEEEKEQRKVTSLKAKASRSKEANIYSPLTSFITAETELCNIVGDLEVIVLFSAV